MYVYADISCQNRPQLRVIDIHFIREPFFRFQFNPKLPPTDWSNYKCRTSDCFLYPTPLLKHTMRLYGEQGESRSIYNKLKMEILRTSLALHPFSSDWFIRPLEISHENEVKTDGPPAFSPVLYCCCLASEQIVIYCLLLNVFRIFRGLVGELSLEQELNLNNGWMNDEV